TLTTLKFQNNCIQDEGAEYLADALRINTTLTKLVVDDNFIGNEGVKHFADALRINTTLTTLDLTNNYILVVKAHNTWLMLYESTQ
ncbi:unnamed protein product, partial [Adineta ricciae]